MRTAPQWKLNNVPDYRDPLPLGAEAHLETGIASYDHSAQGLSAASAELKQRRYEAASEEEARIVADDSARKSVSELSLLFNLSPEERTVLNQISHDCESGLIVDSKVFRVVAYHLGWDQKLVKELFESAKNKIKEFFDFKDGAFTLASLVDSSEN